MSVERQQPSIQNIGYLPDQRGGLSKHAASRTLGSRAGWAVLSCHLHKITHWLTRQTLACASTAKGRKEEYSNEKRKADKLPMI